VWTVGADLRGGLGIDEVLQPGLQQPPVHVVPGQVRIGEEFIDERGQGRLGTGHRGSLEFLAESWKYPR